MIKFFEDSSDSWELAKIESFKILKDSDSGLFSKEELLQRVDDLEKQIKLYHKLESPAELDLLSLKEQFEYNGMYMLFDNIRNDILSK